MRWLINGAAGLLGPYLVEAARRQGEVFTSARSCGDYPCDLTERGEVAKLLDNVQPDIVVHAAGYTDVDGCQSNPSAAFAANRDAPANIAHWLSPDALLVFISTDQVYPDTEGPHPEPRANPANTYGESKLAGEEAVRGHPRHLVLRTNFFGPSRTPGRRSLSDFVAQSLSSGQSIMLFDDVRFSPLHMTTLAALVVELAAVGLTGLYNAGCRDGASKAEFGLLVARHLKLPTDRASVGSSASISGRAPRPHDLRLDVGCLERAIGRTMPTLRQEIEKL